MLRVRPVKVDDHAEILELAKLAGIGMTSLPPDSHVLQHKIDRAVASFDGVPPYERGEAFLFVLEDTETGKLIGTTGIVAHVGIRHPFYSYKLSTIVQASSDLGIYSLQRVLHMVNDYTGASEIGSLFLTPEYRKDGIGKFLSRCRYLLLAEHPQLFGEIVISEIRGVQDAQGDSPFYNNLAKHFFQIDFKRADFVNATQGGQFIADLMPKYPIYVNMLPPDAQATIGQPLDASKPAKMMLEAEGFTHEGYVDVFDAGPTMQVELANIRTVQTSKRMKVIEIRNEVEAADYMIASTELKTFTITRAPLIEGEDGVVINAETAKVLNVGQGDEVRFSL